MCLLRGVVAVGQVTCAASGFFHLLSLICNLIWPPTALIRYDAMMRVACLNDRQCGSCFAARCTNHAAYTFHNTHLRPEKGQDLALSPCFDQQQIKAC